MNLDLIFIDGISREDTLYFTDEDDRDNYMQSQIVTTIEGDGFYPPYFQNSIKLSSDDLNLSTRVNYLRIYYNDKYYYYFIDNVRYISEDVNEIDITMDTIVTFYFDIRVRSAIIERKFIRRYLDNGSINRDYIRENFSNGEFTLREKHIFNKTDEFKGGWNSNISVKIKDNSSFCYIFKCTQAIGRDSINPKNDKISMIGYNTDYKAVPSSTSYNGTGNFGSYHYYILPVTYNNNSSTYAHAYMIVDGVQGNEYDIRDTIKEMAEDPVLVSAYVVPFNCFSCKNVNNVVTTNSLDTLHDHASDFYNIILSDENFAQILRVPTDSVIAPIYYSYEFDIVKNSSLRTPYNRKFVPAMMDINYIQVHFGEGSSQTTLDLYYCTNNIVNMIYYFTIDGSRIYMIEPDSTYITFDDKYNIDTANTIISVDAPSFIDVLSDPWKEYMAYNKYSLAMSMLGDGINLATSGFKYSVDAGIKSSNMLNSLNDIYSKKSNYDRRYKTPGIKLKNKYERQVNSLVTDYENDRNSAAASFISSMPFGNTLGEVTRQLNAQASPKTPKAQGDNRNDYFTGAIQVSYSVYQVNDIERCAQIYHRYGYRVDEYISSVDNIFDYVRNRFYYNYVKLREANIDLERLEDNEDVNDIIQRLESGVRIWNEKTIGTFYMFDNVEIAEVQNG